MYTQHNTVIYYPCHQGGICRNIFSQLSWLLQCPQLPNVTSASLAVISYDRRPDYISSVCATLAFFIFIWYLHFISYERLSQVMCWSLIAMWFHEWVSWWFSRNSCGSLCAHALILKSFSMLQNNLHLSSGDVRIIGLEGIWCIRH